MDSSRPEIENWRIDFRNNIVDRFREIPREGLDLREAVAFAEAVAAEVGPLVRATGFDETERPAELYAAFRSCYLFAVANEAAAIVQTAQDRGALPDVEKLEILTTAFQSEPFDHLFYSVMQRRALALSSFGQSDTVDAMICRATHRTRVSDHSLAEQTIQNDGLVHRLRAWWKRRLRS